MKHRRLMSILGEKLIEIVQSFFLPVQTQGVQRFFLLLLYCARVLAEFMTRVYISTTKEANNSGTATEKKPTKQAWGS